MPYPPFACSQDGFLLESPLRQLLPTGVVLVAVAESTNPHYKGNPLWLKGLTDAEQQIAHNYIDKRLKEFTAGRNCCREALSRLNCRASPSILPDQRRAPRFPEGFIGSITHTDLQSAQRRDQKSTTSKNSTTVNQNHAESAKNRAGNDLITRYCAASLINKSQQAHYLSIGIDVEYRTPINPKLSAMICSEKEQALLRSLKGDSISHHEWIKIAFSAKESFYKAFYPLTHSYLDFLQADITFSPKSKMHLHTGAFEIKITEAARQSKMSPQKSSDVAQFIYNHAHRGYYFCDELFVYTAITFDQQQSLRASWSDDDAASLP